VKGRFRDQLLMALPLLFQTFALDVIGHPRLSSSQADLSAVYCSLPWIVGPDESMVNQYSLAQPLLHLAAWFVAEFRAWAQALVAGRLLRRLS
jgi:hypothetical protein